MAFSPSAVRAEIETLLGVNDGKTTAEMLARLIEAPPPGALDPEDRPPATRASLMLQVALIGSLEWRRFSPVVKAALSWLETVLDQLSRYDAARFWHLRGLTVWRLDDSISGSIRALNASIRLLGEATATPSADAGAMRVARYRPRVLDTFGQLLHHQGLFQEARRELEKALALRSTLLDDRAGMAITLGNLGRLCIDLGDFEAAAAHLERDIQIVEELTPERFRMRSQLLTHLAQCRLALGNVEAAEGLLATSMQYAREASDGGSEAFALIGQGFVMLARGKHADAGRVADDALAKLLRELASPFRSRVMAAAEKLSGHARARMRDVDGAIERYRRARLELSNVPGASPLEHAEILKSLAEALATRHEIAESAQSLRLALDHLDATAAETLRREVEAALRRTSYDSWLLHSAGRFIGQQQIELLLAEAGEQGFRGERRRCSVLFSDIRGFTSMSEHLSPDRLILLLNEFLTQMTRSIERHQGVVDKFIGDAVMALFFHHHQDHQRTATDSILAALAMRDELERFNRRIADDGLAQQMAIGVGIHTGEVVAGLIGSPQKRAYTVIGDVVNTASRIEGMTKQLGASILITSETLAAAGVDADRFLLRPLGSYRPKGRASALRVFDVLGERDRSPASRALASKIERVESALAMFENRKFDRAAEAFRALERDSDAHQKTGYAFLTSQSKKLSASPPPPDWSGEIVLVEK